MTYQKAKEETIESSPQKTDAGKKYGVIMMFRRSMFRWN